MSSLSIRITKYGVVNKDVTSDPQLSLQAKGLYAILCTYADKQRKCYPSIKTLADISNKSVSQVSVYIKELKTYGYLIRSGKFLILR
jgi:hypothetical protein